MYFFFGVFVLFLAVARVQRVMGLAAGLDLNACITSLSFSSTGSLLLAGSRSCPKVLLYETETGVLVGSFMLTANRLLEGINRELNSKFIADDGKQRLLLRWLSNLPIVGYGGQTVYKPLQLLPWRGLPAWCALGLNAVVCLWISVGGVWFLNAGHAIQEYDLSDLEDDLNEGERERKRIRNVKTQNPTAHLSD